MVGSEYTSLSSAFFVVLLTFQGCCHGRLQLTLDRNGDKDYCGFLHCWYLDTSDNAISTISDISLYDITQPDVRTQIATVKNDVLGIKINPSSINNFSGNGSIAGINASLFVNFRSPRDCQIGSFLCELEYVNIDNQRETIGVKSTAPSNSQCDSDSINSQLYTMSTELAALRQQNSNLLLQFQNLSSQLLLIQEYLTSLQTPPSTTAITATGTTTPALGTECSRGMAHSSPRVKFLLWGQIPALCDTESDGGGWVIIQRRTKGDVDFYKDWESYKTGFGTTDTDFWLGNDAIHNLTLRGYNELRVDMVYQGQQYYEQYNVFMVDNEQQNYRLNVSGYTGTAGDSLEEYHNNMTFSTYDRDNDLSDSLHCAVYRHGAWWYSACYASNLNGAWGVNDDTGIKWYALGTSPSLTLTEIKVRQKNIR